MGGAAAPGSAFAASQGQQVDASLAQKLEKLPQMVQGVQSDNPQFQLEATTGFRKLLSIGESAPSCFRATFWQPWGMIWGGKVACALPPRLRFKAAHFLKSMQASINQTGAVY